MPENKKTVRHHSPEFKARVVVELLRGDKTLSQASAEHQVKDSLLSRWKQEFLARAPAVFERGPDPDTTRRLGELEQLFKEQSLELAILKKALSRSPTGSGGRR